MRKAIEVGKPAAEVGQILGQLVDHCEVHRMPEELLMRLDCDDDFEDHTADHTADHMRMVEALKAMVEDDRTGRSALRPGQARSALAFLP